MSCTRVLVAVKQLLVLSVTDWASLGGLRGGFVQWNVRGQCWLEVLQLFFSHFVKLQPCHFVSRHSLIQTKTAIPWVSAEGMRNLIHCWLQRLCSAAGYCCLPSLLFLTFQKALQAPLCSWIAHASNTKHGLYNTRELSSLTRVGLLAFKEVTPLGMLCSTTCRCWTFEFMIEHLALEELNLLPSERH